MDQCGTGRGRDLFQMGQPPIAGVLPMIPKPPPREASPGFLYIPPFRVYGTSVAGESTCIMIPELDTCFDMGECLRPALAAKYVAISHGHMDHIGALAYYCSQRRFQGMGTGKIVCDSRLVGPIQRMMTGFVDLEQQRTPYELLPLEHEQQIEVKPNIFLRGFVTEHTSPSMGYVLIERRSKLKSEFTDLPQEKLRELKDRGIEITRTLEIPLVAYLGDTAPGPHLIRSDVLTAQIVLCECTFFEPEHRERAKVGMHLHVHDIVEWMGVLQTKALILTHISRRTHLGFARQELTKLLGPEKAGEVFFLMDGRFNRDRYERQEAEAAAAAARPSA
jgi:ribonuclease Z